jgi:hypothetical protein
MTARARITQADLAQAAALVKAEGVTVTIATANGKSVTIAPTLDVKPESDHDDRKPKPWT